MDDLNILLFIVSADIVSFKQPSLLLYHIDRLRMIFHIQPVPDILSIAIHRQLLSLQCIVDDQRNQFFRELIGTIIVGTVCDVGREFIGVHISLHKHVRTGLAGRVGTVGRIGGRLIKVFAVTFQGTIYLIRGDM
jgi:hypothetical protein